MNFKRYIEASDTWVDSHYIMGTSTDTITTLPTVLYPNAATATVGLKGNTVQSGTPTPENPIMPEGCGNETANLCASTSTLSGTLIVNVSNIKTVVLNDDFFELSFDAPNLTFSGNSVYLHTDSINRVITTVNGSGHIVTTFKLTAEDINSILASNTNYFYVYKSGADFSTVSNVGLYGGYKIPISCGGTTNNVYLGEVRTTRRVKKFVLTGEENIDYSKLGVNNRFTVSNAFQTADYHIGICSHYNYEFVNANNTVYHTSNNMASAIFIFDNNYTSAADFKSYLAAQYAAGTPVTVWYVLANEETGIVNEPLMKIGDYADTVSGISIPTIAGANTLSVDTTLQPSEVTVNYKGWHSIQNVHEAENGQWD